MLVIPNFLHIAQHIVWLKKKSVISFLYHLKLEVWSSRSEKNQMDALCAVNCIFLTRTELLLLDRQSEWFQTRSHRPVISVRFVETDFFSALAFTFITYFSFFAWRILLKLTDLQLLYSVSSFCFHNFIFAWYSNNNKYSNYVHPLTWKIF